MTDPFIWILADDELKAASEIWQKAAFIAIDTEFVRTDTFYPKLGLVQLCVDDQIWLVDPLKISDWSSFAAVLTNKSIVKVLHSLSEDAEVLLYCVGVKMENVFDSQIAAGFLGMPVQASYAKLVEALFNIDLPKEATRSDWLKRPLNAEQCEYAAADVHWLYKIYQIFSEQLKSNGRYDWVKEDSARMANNNQAVAPENYYLKMRGAWKLKGSRLLALQQMASWREKLARETDCNRGRILKDKELIIIAEKMPTNVSFLSQVLKLPSRKIRLFGDKILSFVSESEDAKRDEWPARIDGPLPADQADLYKDVREKISEISIEHDVPVEILARRKLLEEWVRSGCRDGNYVLPEGFSGWRKSMLFEAVNEMLLKQWADLYES